MYQTRIDSGHPQLIVFAVDRSESTDDLVNVAGSQRPICELIAQTLNRTIVQVAHTCRPRGVLRDYAYVSAIMYGNDQATVGFGGALGDRPIVPITELIANPLDFHEGDPVWITPLAKGSTPMCAGLNQCVTVLGSWCAEHPEAPAPIVMHITDGESTDGGPKAAMQRIVQVGTNDGPTILFNIHLSKHSGQAERYPETAEHLQDPFAELLFNLSSVLPEHMRKAARRFGLEVGDSARAMVFNAEPADLWQALSVGTVLNR